MKTKQSALAAAMTVALTMGAAGQASAYVYSAAGISINQLNLVITPNGGTVNVSRFDFNLTNTATLGTGPGSSVISTATCGGTPGAGNNNCSAVPPGLDAAAVNAPSSSPVIRSNNASTGGEFTFYGPTSGGNWSNSDSVINTAELVQIGSPSNTNNIAESMLSTGTNASALSQIQSITGFTISFTTTGGPASLNLSFLADPDLRASIFGESGTYSAQANLNVSFTLNQNQSTSGGPLSFVNWNPQGTAVNDCISFNGATCIETNDSQDLNINVGTTVNNTTSDHSFDPNVLTLTPFGIAVGNLSAGSYSLTLNEVKSTNLARTPATIPEPGVLALMGIGLMGLGMSAFRKKST